MSVETHAGADLVEKIVAAAEAAVLTGDPRRLTMVNLELEIRLPSPPRSVRAARDGP